MCVLYYLWFELQHLLSTPSSLCIGRERKPCKKVLFPSEREGRRERRGLVQCVAGCWDFSRLNRKTLRGKKKITLLFAFPQ